MSEDSVDKIDETNDFGFVALDVHDTPNYNDPLNSYIKLKNFVINFLNKMAENPDKDYIYWPDREEKIKDIINKIEYGSY